MKKVSHLILLLIIFSKINIYAGEVFPDGIPISDWFKTNTPTDINILGKHYRITDFGVVNDSTIIQTQKIQAIIDRAHQAGGGVILVPEGTFLSGSLFFKPGTHLHLEENAVLKGSDDISNFQLLTTRIEGQTIKYFAALVNADNVNGFTISGKGTLNGNGMQYWKSFWLRREFNPQCTNLDEMRPRVLYVSNSKNIQISGVRLVNSPFWTSHFYRCENLKLLNLYIYAPHSYIKAPSSDAIDLDVCKNVLIKDCYMSVNDDAISLKGGKGPLADKDGNNGGNYNIIIEDCVYGFCHSALTCGSESIHNYNIILRRCKVDNVRRVLQLKMRPDTPQKYEYILIEDITGNANHMLDVNPWMQFFDLKGEIEMKVSQVNNITFRNIELDCNIAFNIKKSDQYNLSSFLFENINISEKKDSKIQIENIQNSIVKNTIVNGENLASLE